MGGTSAAARSTPASRPATVASPSSASRDGPAERADERVGVDARDAASCAAVAIVGGRRPAAGRRPPAPRRRRCRPRAAARRPAAGRRRRWTGGSASCVTSSSAAETVLTACSWSPTHGTCSATFHTGSDEAARARAVASCACGSAAASASPSRASTPDSTVPTTARASMSAPAACTARNADPRGGEHQHDERAGRRRARSGGPSAARRAAARGACRGPRSVGPSTCALTRSIVTYRTSCAACRPGRIHPAAAVRRPTPSAASGAPTRASAASRRPRRAGGRRRGAGCAGGSGRARPRPGGPTAPRRATRGSR